MRIINDTQVAGIPICSHNGKIGCKSENIFNNDATDNLTTLI
jgi:hypothetical protein